MKWNYFLSIVVVLLLATVVVAQDEVTYETYTSDDGRISFESPAGWVVDAFGQFFVINKHGFYVEPADLQPGQQSVSIGILNMEDIGVTSDLGLLEFTEAVLNSFGDETSENVVIDGSRTMTLDSGVEVGVFDVSEGTSRYFVLAYPQDGVAVFVSAQAYESEYAVLEPVALHVVNSIQLGENAAEAPPAPEYPVASIVGTDEGIQLPPVPEGGVPAGIYTFQMTNNQTEGEFAGVIARINDGVSMEDFMAAASAENPMAAVAMVTLNGGSPLQPGESTSYILHLVPGNYIILNFAGDGPPTDAATFTVVEGDIMDVAEPVADVHLAMVDFAFGVPGFMPAGEQVWHLENVGDQWHETVIIPLPEGIESVSDVLEVMASGNEPDIQPAFFFAPMSPGAEAWVTVDLAPGNYVILCFLPDLNGDFSPHINHGMIQVFTVE